MTASRILHKKSTTVDLSGTPWRRLELSERLGIWCLIDADDYDWIIGNNWNYGWHNRTPWKYYAKRNVGAERSTIYLHREIMLRPSNPARAAWVQSNTELHVDHINGQSLDDRKANLRWVTPVQNMANRVARAAIPSLDTIVAELMKGLVLPVEVPF